MGNRARDEARQFNRSFPPTAPSAAAAHAHGTRGHPCLIPPRANPWAQKKTPPRGGVFVSMAERTTATEIPFQSHSVPETAETTGF